MQVDTLVLESMLRAQLPAVLDHFNELKMGTHSRPPYSITSPQAAVQSLRKRHNSTERRRARRETEPSRCKPIAESVAEWQGCRS